MSLRSANAVTYLGYKMVPADAKVTHARWNFLERAPVSSRLEGEEE